MNPSFLFPGDGRSVDEIAAAYCREHEAQLGFGDPIADDEWARFHVGNLTLGDRVEEAWPIVVAAIDRTEDERVLDFLGAGDLETIVRDHGPRFIDRIEAEARRSTRFRTALAGVWAHESPVHGRIVALLTDA